MRLEREKLIAAALLSAVIFPLCLLAMRAEDTYVVHVDLWTSLDHPASAQIFWEPSSAEDAGFRPANSRSFATTPGSSFGSVPIPSDAIALRLDPLPEPGVVRVGRIAIDGPFGIEIARWDAGRGFDGWAPNEQLRDVGVREGALEMQAHGVDPYLVLSDLSAAHRRAETVSLALAVGITLAVAALLVLALSRLLGKSVAASERSDARTVAFRWLAALLALSFLAGSGWIGWRLLARRTAPAFPAGHGYTLMLVDHRGRSLSPRLGELLVTLDPHTGLRHFPNQKTPLFTIDENGFRGPPPPRGRPLAMVVGGSTAFGHSLASDAETLSARLNEASPRWGWINAAMIGFLSGQELALMVHHLDRFRPELYVVLDGWNDLNAQLGNQGRRYDTYGFNQEMFWEVEQRICTSAPAPSAIETRTREPIGDGEHLDLIIEAYGENLSKMHDFARSRGARLVVAFQPELGSKRRVPHEEELWHASQSGIPKGFGEKYRKLVDRSLERCRAHGIDCIDLDASPEIRDHPGVLFVDPVHLDATGHRVMAEVIARHLAKK